MNIGGRDIGPGQPPFIVAELSGNHNRSLDRALALVDAAADAGAHGVKLQTYTADTMTLDLSRGDFLISDPDSLWHGRTLYDLYDEAHTPWEWHEPILARCRERGVIGFSSPFDATAVAFLQEFEVPCYKIASFENTDLPLIRSVAATGKPVIISTGMASFEELAETVDTAREAGCKDLILLKCTSAYPARPDAMNLRTIPDLQERFGVQVGLSDHTMGLGVSLAAVALGTTLIEKHFTLSRVDGGVDSAFSLEPAELKALVEESEKAWRALGRVTYEPTVTERESIAFRRSLYVVRNLRAGHVLREGDFRAIRPGAGLPPKHYAELLGRALKTDVVKGTPLGWELLE